MEILGLIDTLESMILEGFRVPLTKKTMINEEKVLQVIDKIRLVAQGGGSLGPGMTQVLFIGLMFAAMYFLLIAPQRKKQKEHDALLKALKTGDDIITSAGIFGTITNACAGVNRPTFIAWRRFTPSTNSISR